MQPWPIWAWALWGLASLFLALALWLFYRGLWRDPARGTRRCPRCTHELTGVPGLRCPECGHVAKSEKTLRFRKRSWRTTLAGLALCLLAAGLILTPRIARDHWWSVTPRTALILMWPDRIPGDTLRAKTDPSTMTRAELAAYIQTLSMLPPGGVLAPSSLADRIVPRIDPGSLWGWQRRLLASRCAACLRERDGFHADRTLRMLAALGTDAAPATMEVARYGVDKQQGPFVSPNLEGDTMTLLRDMLEREERAAVICSAAPPETRVREIARALAAAALAYPRGDPHVEVLVNQWLSHPAWVPLPLLERCIQSPTHQELAVLGSLARGDSAGNALQRIARTDQGLVAIVAALPSVRADVSRRQLLRTLLHAAPRTAVVSHTLEQAAQLPSDRIWCEAIAAKITGDTAAVSDLCAQRLDPAAAAEWSTLSRLDAVEIVGACRLSADRFVPYLIAAGNDDSLQMQYSAAESLAMLSSQDPQALAALRALAASGRTDAQARARELLTSLESNR